MEWLFIMAAVFAAALLGFAYLTACVGRFAWVRRLSGGSKWRRRGISLAILAAAFALLTLALSFFNAVVVFLHAVLFFLLCGLGARLVRRVRGKASPVYWQGRLALGFCAVYLTAGFVLCSHVWQTDYRLQTDKPVGTLKIALIADSHLGTTFDGEGFARHLARIEDREPDLLVIAGDFVDDSSTKADLLRACEALGQTRFPYGVWYVYGNHDKGYYNSRDFSAAELEAALRQNGVHVLADSWESVGGRLVVAGRLDASMGPRLEAEALLADADPAQYLILLDHQPSDYEGEARSPADLVLSGHTHGGQLIPINNFGLWFGMVDREYGLERRNGTDFIVTSGISDWELLFKTGTRSEYVIITVEGKTA